MTIQSVMVDAVAETLKNEFHAALARRFCARGVVACLWRDRDEFPRLVGFDMDMVVGAGWSVLAHEIRGTATACGWRVESVVRRGHLQTWLLRRVSGAPLSDCDTLQVDLHRFLTVRALPYVDVKGLLARRTIRDGAFFLDRSDAAVISCVESWLAGAPVKPRYVAELRAAKQRDPDRVRDLMIACLGKDVAQSFDPALPRQGNGAVFYSLLRRPLGSLSVLLRKLASAAGAFWNPSGAVVAISGPDGVGKTTAIEVLRQRAPRRIATGVVVYHSRPFLLPRLAALAPGRQKRERILTERAYEPNLSPLKSWLRVVVLVLDYNLGYWLKVRRQLARGALVIFDRSFLDFRVDPRIRGIDLSQRTLAGIAAIIPRPDFSVVLVASAQTVTTRKQELTLDEAQKQVDRYREVAAQTGRCLLVDTEQASPAQVADAIAAQLSRVRAGLPFGEGIPANCKATP